MIIFHSYRCVINVIQEHLLGFPATQRCHENVITSGLKLIRNVLNPNDVIMEPFLDSNMMSVLHICQSYDVNRFVRNEPPKRYIYWLSVRT